MPGKRFIFNRAALATEMADGIEGTSCLTDYSSGLFLAAPSQTGKTTFIHEDLLPEMEQRGWMPLYVDLGADPHLDPGFKICRLIAEALEAYTGAQNKVVMLDGHLQLAQSVTMADALDAVHKATGKLIALVIDDVERALQTTWGANALFALKAARDALNIDREPEGIRLVMIGNNQADVRKMTTINRQPFFCATYQDFPLLGRSFTDAYTRFINERLAETNQFDVEDMHEAFTGLGFSPRRLMDAAKEVAVTLGSAPQLGKLINNKEWADSVGLWIEAPASVITPRPSTKEPSKKLQNALQQAEFIRSRNKETEEMLEDMAPISDAPQKH